MSETNKICEKQVKEDPDRFARIPQLYLRSIYMIPDYRRYITRYLLAMLIIVLYPVMYLPVLIGMIGLATWIPGADAGSVGIMLFVCFNFAMLTVLSLLLVSPVKQLKLTRGLGNICQLGIWVWGGLCAFACFSIFIDLVLISKSILMLVTIVGGMLLCTIALLMYWVLCSMQVLTFQRYLSDRDYGRGLGVWLVLSFILGFMMVIIIAALGRGGGSEPTDLLLLIPPLITYGIWCSYWVRCAWQLVICYLNFDALVNAYQQLSGMPGPELLLRDRNGDGTTTD